MTPEWSLRAIRDGEADDLLALHRASMGGYIEATWGPWNDAVQQAFFDARLGEGMLQVIDVGGAAAGLLEVKRGTEDVLVVNLELAPEFQGQGIGSAILRDIIAEAGDLPVRLQVLKVNPAKRLYDRLGFAVISESEQYWQMRREPTNSQRPGASGPPAATEGRDYGRG